jgi:hypothetical protein
MGENNESLEALECFYLQNLYRKKGKRRKKRERKDELFLFIGGRGACRLLDDATATIPLPLLDTTVTP